MIISLLTSHFSLLYGGHNRDRTYDPLLVRQVLPQLSYAPISDVGCEIFFSLLISHFPPLVEASNSILKTHSVVKWVFNILFTFSPSTTFDYLTLSSYNLCKFSLSNSYILSQK